MSGRPRLAWSLAGLTIGLLAATFVLQLGTRSAGTAANFDPVTIGLFAALLGFAVVGALITTHRPERIGWVFLLAALVYAADLVINQYADYTMLARHGALWPGIWAGWLSDLLWFPANSILMVFVFLLFPDGRLPGSRWAIVARVALAMCAVELIAGAFHPGALSQPLGAYDNPAGIDGADWIDWAMIAAFVVTLACWGAAIVSLLVRYRRSDPVRRAQIRWFVLAAALVPVALALGGLAGPLAYPIIIGAMVAVPVSVGVAIMRYRLYDIDVLIRRTVTYTVLAVLLGAGYLAGIWLLGDVLRSLTGASGALAVTITTLAVWAAFQPLRGWVQAAVDRRFARERYDSARTLEAFGGRLRDELDLETLRGEMVMVVDETLRPAHVSLWLRQAEGER